MGHTLKKLIKKHNKIIIAKKNKKPNKKKHEMIRIKANQKKKH